jgi:hypothetical protein
MERRLSDQVVDQIGDFLGGDRTVKIMNHYVKKAGKEPGEV